MLLTGYPGLSSHVHAFFYRESRLHFEHMHGHMEMGRTRETHTFTQTHKAKLIHSATGNWSKWACVHVCLMSRYEACSHQSPVYNNMIITLSSVNAPLRVVTVEMSRHQSNSSTYILFHYKNINIRFC